MKQYLDLLKNILENGCEKGDRTGTGTKSIFGTQMRFNLQEGFPLVTTKKVHFKSIVHELLWILSGDTNIKYLTDNGVRIWNEWADENGDLGPVYGHQMRRWGKYTLSKFEGHEFYVEEEIDQIGNAIDLIKSNPMSRRIIVNSWNPSDLPEMALAPCHCFFQFNCRPLTKDERIDWLMNFDHTIHSPTALKNAPEEVFESRMDELNIPKSFLDSHLYQRSCDVGLGLSYNIASYSLLTHMIAQITNTIPGDFVWTGGDTHIYLDHIEPLKEQMKREPHPLPKIKLNPEIKNIDDFTYGDIELLDYECHPHIKMKVSV